MKLTVLHLRNNNKNDFVSFFDTICKSTLNTPHPTSWYFVNKTQNPWESVIFEVHNRCYNFVTFSELFELPPKDSMFRTNKSEHLSVHLRKIVVYLRKICVFVEIWSTFSYFSMGYLGGFSQYASKRWKSSIFNITTTLQIHHFLKNMCFLIILINVFIIFRENTPVNQWHFLLSNFLTKFTFFGYIF